MPSTTLSKVDYSKLDDLYSADNIWVTYQQIFQYIHHHIKDCSNLCSSNDANFIY